MCVLLIISLDYISNDRATVQSTNINLSKTIYTDKKSGKILLSL